MTSQQAKKTPDLRVGEPLAEDAWPCCALCWVCGARPWVPPGSTYGRSIQSAISNPQACRCVRTQNAGEHPRVQRFGTFSTRQGYSKAQWRYEGRLVFVMAVCARVARDLRKFLMH